MKMNNDERGFWFTCGIGCTVLFVIAINILSLFLKDEIQPGDVVYSHTHNEKFLVLKQLENDRLLTAPIDTFVLRVEERGKNVNKLEYQ
jgi:hypothetical protein